MADTSVKLPTAMVSEIRKKVRDNTAKYYFAGMIVSLALDLWARDLWVPGPDIELDEDSYILSIRVQDEAFEAALKKKKVTGTHLSVVIRRALRDWLDGKWDVGLVRNES